MFFNKNNKNIEVKYIPGNNKSNEPNIIGDLLKQATQEKKNNQIEKAIVTLKKAYETIIEMDLGEYPVETYLRLPLYLDEAGKHDEAWKEFNNLLANYIKKIDFSSISAVHDKMRLTLYRRGDIKEALRNGVLSYLYKLIGIYKLSKCGTWKVDPYLNKIKKENIQSDVNKISNKIKDKNINQELFQLIQNHIKTIPMIDFNKVNQDINDILKDIIV